MVNQCEQGRDNIRSMFRALLANLAPPEAWRPLARPRPPDPDEDDQAVDHEGRANLTEHERGRRAAELSGRQVDEAARKDAKTMGPAAASWPM